MVVHSRPTVVVHSRPTEVAQADPSPQRDLVTTSQRSWHPPLDRPEHLCYTNPMHTRHSAAPNLPRARRGETGTWSSPPRFAVYQARPDLPDIESQKKIPTPPCPFVLSWVSVLSIFARHWSTSWDNARETPGRKSADDALPFPPKKPVRTTTGLYRRCPGVNESRLTQCSPAVPAASRCALQPAPWRSRYLTTCYFYGTIH